MVITNFRPMNDRVLIEPLDLGEQRKGSILIPDLGEDRVRIGKVIAVGPGRVTEFGKLITVNSKVGDTVIVPKIGAQRVEIDEKEYWTIADKELIARVDIKDED